MRHVILTSPRFSFLCRAALAAALAGGCAAQDTGAPVFGGQGAVVDPGARAAAVEAQPARGPCDAPASASEDVRLDDFEDGDNRLFGGFEREGWWFTATDHSQGGTVFPPDGKFEPVKLGAEGTLDNQFAAHLTGSGYTDWGISWGVTLHHVDAKAKCPLNAGNFAGIRLRARGKGSILMRFGIPETTGAEFGGSCTEKCWDLHTYVLRLSDDWQVREVRWDQLQQGGWGKSARFDPKRLLSLQFAAPPQNQPADVWLDDIEWVRASTPTSNAAAPAAQKGP
jgi:hypothetical protein